ncbi:MAG: GerMN domain-containing protein [bacterium]
MKKSILTILIIIAVIAGVISLRFLLGGSEDEWVCENGEWVKHGEPSEDGCWDQEEEGLDGKQIEDSETGRESDKSNLIRVEIPKPDDIIFSPLTVKGEARGNWFFEGSFPVKLYNENNNLLSVSIAQAKGEWMTENLVPFEAEIVFDNPGQGKGTLVFEKDNPSDMPELDDELRIPVFFGSQDPLSVKVYFNNSKLDPEFSCNKVFPVEREIYDTKAVARAAIEELLKGPTEDEKANGFFTSINSGVKINSLSIENKIARIDFAEGIEYQVGGSCRVSAIRAEITETLKQFDSVDEVIISVNGRTKDILQP